MAHEFETGLFVTTPAWHGLGVVLEQAPSVAEAIVKAGLDWEVKERALWLGDRKTKITTHRAMVRSTDGAVLGVVGSDFTPLQNKDAFAWFQPIVESGEATIEAAGSLREGKRIWILAAVKGATAEVQPGDPVKSYILLAHGHDGSLAIRAGFTQTRVVCANTLSMALSADGKSKKKNLLTFRHTSGAKASLEEARTTFDMQRARLKADVDTYRELAKRKCDDKNLVRYVREVLVAGAADDPKKRVVGVDKILPLFEEGRGSDLTRGTMWGAFNAVTEWVTHERGRNQDSRQNANWFGYGPTLMKRALDVAVQFAADAPMAEQSRAAYSNHATAAAETAVLLAKPRHVKAEPTAAAPSGDLASLLQKPRRKADDVQAVYDEAMARS